MGTRKNKIAALGEATGTGKPIISCVALKKMYQAYEIEQGGEEEKDTGRSLSFVPFL